MFPSKFLVIVPLVILSAGVSVGGARAQGVPAFQRDGAVAGPPLRVQVNINLQRNIGASDSADDQAKAMEAARRAIYDSVKSECALLSEAFSSDCRLVNVNAGSSVMDRGNMTPMVSANGNASFELTPRAQDGK